MNPRNHTSTLATVSGSRRQRWPMDVYASQRDGKRWLRILSSVLLLSSMLLSTVGMVPAYALDVPTLIAPADFSTTTADVGDTPPLGIPEFKWAAVTGATNYRLQVSNAIGFNTTIVDIVTPNTAYTPNSVNSFSDGTWYWRVRVEAPLPVGTYSDIWSFTKQWATLANSPVLISPADSATIDFYDDPIFSWSPVTGAAKYKLQIYASSGGWSTTLYTVTTLATTHQPPNKLANGTYYWRVVPVDAGNHDGTPSAERSFTEGYNPVLTLLAPNPNVLTHPTFTPTFRWTAVRGAQFYRLQYSTDPSFGSGVTQIDTRNIAYTPTSTLSNDVNYYWRVGVYSGSSISNWTTASQPFVKQWYIQPVLLTPTNNYQHQRWPMFSWTPVPGAGYYHVEISKFAGFSPLIDSGDTANTFWTPPHYYVGSDFGSPLTYYWRVTPYDGNGKAGVPSSSSYRSWYAEVAPEQVYPSYYYPPDTYSGFPGVTTSPHEDRTVPWPIFIWHRVYKPAFDPNQGQVYADAYRLQVSTDATFASVNWTVDTQNTVATPTAGAFTPLPNTDYYWRVCSLIGGVCSDATNWSQVWKTRFNPSLALAATTGPAPQLIRPTDGFEFADTTPLLEWFPLSGATSYNVQISLDQNFSSTVDTATVSSPAYAPSQGLAQRSLGAVDFGTYYWRVRQSPSGAWSTTGRFQIAAESQWQFTRTLGDAANQLQIGSDLIGDVTPAYDLTNLQAAQSSAKWYFGFHVPTYSGTNVTYALYLDLDHKDASGATTDALGYSVTTNSTHRPEYAIYVFQEAGSFTANRVLLYHWNGSGWDTVSVLATIGGQISQNGNYVELEVPNTAIGYDVNTTASYSASLFSLPAGSGQPQDSVPSDPNVPGAGPISRFANVTERMNLVMPPNNAGVDPSTFATIQPFFWDWSVLAPWSGARMRAYTDPSFTTQIVEGTYTSDTAYWAEPSYAWAADFTGDNTYYWRVQPQYRVGASLYYGAWSQGGRFERKGFVPQNLQTSVTFATPTFSWDLVEGAESYDLQVGPDPSFISTPPINISQTRQNSYTDITTLANGIYYWRVRAHRHGNVTNSWTSNQSFTLALPAPTGLTPSSGTIVGRAATLCWTPLIQNSLTGDPVLAAWKYRVQVSKDPTFSTIFDSIDTEQSCWTPIKGYDDGQYYWHVAMIDGNARAGAYTANQTFTKQYPITTLVSPITGAGLNSTPTFVWTPVNGAAHYRLEVSQVPTFSPLYDSVTTDNTRYTPTKSYTIPKTYYWRVAIVDSDGKLGPFVGAIIILDPYPFRIYLPLVKR